MAFYDELTCDEATGVTFGDPYEAGIDLLVGILWIPSEGDPYEADVFDIGDDDDLVVFFLTEGEADDLEPTDDDLRSSATWLDHDLLSL